MATEHVPGVQELMFPKALVNAFLVRADVPTLIDTGTPGGEAKVLSALRDAGIEVGRILLTHRHADHIGNVAALARATGAEVHISPVDAPYLTEGREQPKPKAATRLGYALVPYVSVALPWRLPPVPVQATLSAGAQVGPFRVHATPGHTAGHVALLWEERGVLFTGDAAANITGVGPHPAADDPAQARESFRGLSVLDFDAACFGHGRTIASGARAKFGAG